MKSSFKKVTGSQIVVEVTLEQEEFLPYYKSAYDKALASVQVKGFRPGAAPKEMADQGVDKEAVFNQSAQAAIRWSLDEISKDKEWTLIDAPKVEVEEAKLGIKYKATLTVFPEIKLGNYKKIANKVVSEKKEVSVEAGELEKTLEWLRQSRKEGEKVPELNDEFAKTVGKFQTLEELKKNVNEGILMEKQFKERDRLRLKMLEEIIKASEIDLPLIMVEKTEASMAKQLAAMLKASGKTDEQIHKELHERAGHNVMSNLIIYKIAQDEKLEPTPEEVGEEGDYNYNYGVLLNEKVYAFLEKQ
ncbi:MAG: trigger factor [bacterium]|nr:trigger factor [bacterium]